MCYRNGTGHRCECCGKETTGFKVISYDINLSNKKEMKTEVSDQFCCEWENKFCTGQKSLEPVLMIAVTPGEPMRIVREVEANQYLPFFEDTDAISEVPGLDLVMSYGKEGIIQIGSDYYLEGPCLIYNLNEEGETVSLSGEMMYAVQEWVKSRTVPLCQGGAELSVFDLN